MLQGLYAANLTPFGEGSGYHLDKGAYLEHVAWLAEKGVTGIIPFGTNGEGSSVGLDEKLGILEALYSRNFPIEIIPAVMEGNLPGTLKMLEALEDYPAAATLILPPYYIKPVSEEGLRLFFEPVLATTHHKVVLYHIPKYAVPVPAKLVLDLPVWGVKDSSDDPGYAKTLLDGDRGILLGTEDDLWRRLSDGAQGAVSALANFIPEVMVELYEEANAGNEESGKSLSEMVERVRAMTKEYTSVALLKKLAESRHGVPMGSVRPPLTPVPDDYDPSCVLELVGLPR